MKITRRNAIKKITGTSLLGVLSPWVFQMISIFLKILRVEHLSIQCVDGHMLTSHWKNYVKSL